MTIKEELFEYAKSVGIDLIGVTSPDPFETYIKEFEARKELYEPRYEYRFETWNRLARPLVAMPDAKSVVVIGVNYYTPELTLSNGDAQFGRIVTYGHLGVYRKIKLITKFMQDRGYKVVPGLHRKEAAQRAGLGAVCKNDLVMNEKFGSWVAYQTFATDAEMEFDSPYTVDICGDCTACLEACPTKALYRPYKLNPKRCITSLLTSPEIPEEFWPLMSGYIMGCDICQLKCPKNRGVVAHQDIISIFPKWVGETPSLEMMLTISDDDFQKKVMGYVMGLFLNNPLISFAARFPFLKKLLKKLAKGKKTETLPETFQMASDKLTAYQRNAILAAARSQNPRYLPLVEKFVKIPETKKYAEWAIERIRSKGDK